MKTRTTAEKKLAEQRYDRQWIRWRRERAEALLAGPHGAATQSLLASLKTATKPSKLIDFIARGPWSDADADTRFEILALIDGAIIARREKLGLPPFDDAIGDKPLNVFLLIREQLNHDPTSQEPSFRRH
jgi:hypothetical protein